MKSRHALIGSYGTTTGGPIITQVSSALNYCTSMYTNVQVRKRTYKHVHVRTSEYKYVHVSTSKRVSCLSGLMKRTHPRGCNKRWCVLFKAIICFYYEETRRLWFCWQRSLHSRFWNQVGIRGGFYFWMYVRAKCKLKNTSSIDCYLLQLLYILLALFYVLFAVCMYIRVYTLLYNKLT